MRILIIKTGAMGDVLRTSYACRYLKYKYGNRTIIDFITSVDSLDLIRYNCYIDSVFFIEHLNKFDFNVEYDLTISLEESFKEISMVKTKKITGIYFNENGLQYSDDSSYWFDMSLVSQYGKTIADKLKKTNKKSYNDILGEMIGIRIYEPTYFFSLQAREFKLDDNSVGLNLFAGGRWKSKSLSDETNLEITKNICEQYPNNIYYLIAGKDNIERAVKIKETLNKPNLKIIYPDSIDRISSFISQMKLLITTDSLCMHIGISTHTKVLAFFTCTSAAEIEMFGNGNSITLQTGDYCSYKPEIDTSSITWRDFQNCIEINKLLDHKL